jgi:hypothetical protein
LNEERDVISEARGRQVWYGKEKKGFLQITAEKDADERRF